MPHCLLEDKRAYAPEDYPHIIFHLKKVTCDAIERPWVVVRRWSQFIWDAVETGHLRWSDKAIIQEERVRMCLTDHMPNNSYNSTQHVQGSVHRKAPPSHEVVCRQFNTRAGCYHRESHSNGTVQYLHVCSYCDSIGRLCYHSVRECERRINHARQPNDKNAQYRNRNASFQPVNQNGQFSYYQPKNLFQAPAH